ncbi:hypothetical protein RclHR1_00560022 [Rhizophagus clarus]|uniref:Uncharacterized protein n=1 Tax=Rhizophagus clarus TaxID=94130 RepID=A0A2Z6S0M7_9GLOM|nr:hypothetical protein RclHR1_00560022 [Rhizophagus clarus]
MIGTYTTNGMISPMKLRLIICDRLNSQAVKNFVMIGSEPNATKISMKTIKIFKPFLETKPNSQTFNKITSGIIIPIQMKITIESLHESFLICLYNARFVIVIRQMNKGNAENANTTHLQLVKCRSRITSVTDDGL